MRPMAVTSLLAVVAVALGAGCAPRALRVDGQSDLPAEGSPEYIDRLSTAETVSESDAVRGLILLLDGSDRHADFSARVKALADRGIVNPRWDFQAERDLTRGKLAYMIYQATGIRGGIVLMISGPSQRYCLRELQFHDMMGSGAVYGPVSGMEMVAVLGRADAYRRSGEVPDELKPAGS